MTGILLLFDINALSVHAVKVYCDLPSASLTALVLEATKLCS